MNKLCPPANVLSNYALGQLDESTSSEIDSHLQSCETCQQKVDTVWSGSGDPLISALRETANPTPSNLATQKEPAAPSETVRDYRLLRLLGRGGMGAVYLAEHQRIGKHVALKLIKSERLQEEKTKARFEREMRAMGALDHPNLVKAIDAGEHEGRMYLAMEYIDGASLGDISHSLRQLSYRDACEAIRRAATGLQYACDELQHFVHRDIKPSNLLLSRNGEVKVADLGLVRAGNLFQDDASLTATNSFIGTLDYTAPEQIDRGQDVDVRADIYALGATLYKLLTGQVTHHGERFDSFSDKIHGISKLDPTPISEHRPDLPSELAELIDRMLAKDPERRIATPGEVAKALAPFCESADLAQLVEEHMAMQSDVDEEEATSTFDYVTSAHADTQRSEVPTRASRPIVQLDSDQGSPPIPRKWLIGGIGGLIAILAGIVLVIPTEKGELTVDLKNIDEATLKITRVKGRVIEEGLVITKDKKSKTLKAGEYDIEIVDANDLSLVLSDDRVTIKKGEPAQVEVTRTSKNKPPPIPPPPIPDPDPPIVIPVQPDDAEPIQVGESPRIVRKSLVQPVPKHLSPWKKLANQNSRYIMITKGHAGRVQAVAIHPDGNRFATVGEDRVLRFWSRDGQLTRAVPMEKYVAAISWSPDGKELAIGAEEELRILDPETGKQIDRLRGHVRNHRILTVEWSPSGKKLLVCDGTGADIIDVESGQFREKFLQGCNIAKWRNDDQILTYLANYDTGDFKLLAIDANTLFEKVVSQFDENRHFVDGRDWAISPDGKRVVSVTGAHVQITNIETGTSELIDQEVVNNPVAVAWTHDALLSVLSANNGPAWISQVGIGDKPTLNLKRDVPRHDGNCVAAWRGELGVFTHADGAITIVTGESSTKTITGAFVQKHRGMFWRDQGRKLCIPEVESLFNDNQALALIDFENGSFNSHRNFSGVSFPNVDPLVTSTTHARYAVWDVATGLGTSRGQLEGKGDVVSISPDLERVIRFDHGSQKWTMTNSSDKDSAELDISPSSYLSCGFTWSPSHTRFACPVDNDSVFGIGNENGFARFASNEMQGSLKGMEWPHPNRLEIITQQGEVFTYDVKANGNLEITQREEFELDCDAGAVFENRVALYVAATARVYIFDRKQMKHVGTIQLLPRYQLAIIGSDGKYVENPQAENFLTFVVDTGDEYEVVSTSDFHRDHVSNKLAELKLFENDAAVTTTPPHAIKIEPHVKSTTLPTGSKRRMSPYTLVSHPTAIDGVETWTLETANHRGSLAACEYSPDGTRIATSNNGDGAIRVYNMLGGTARLAKIIVTPGHGPMCWIDDSTIVSGGREELFVWDVATGRLKRTMLGEGRWWFESIRYLPASNKLLAARVNTYAPEDQHTPCRVDLIDPETFNEELILKNVGYHEAKSIEVHPSGKQILGILDDESGKVLRVWDSLPTTRNSPTIRKINQVNAARWSPDGKHVAIFVKGKLAIVTHDSFIAGKAKSRRQPFSAEHTFEDIAWSRDGNSIAAWDGGNFFVIDTNSASSDGQARKDEGCQWVSWGDKYLAHCRDNGTKFLNPKTSAELSSIESLTSVNHRWSTTRRQMSPDSEFIASSNRVSMGQIAWSPSGKFFFDGEGQVCDSSTRKPTGIVVDDYPNSAFSNDDRWFVAATAHSNYEGTSKVDVWGLDNPAAPKKTWSFEGPTNCLSIADNGKFIVAGQSGAYLYDLNELSSEPRRLPIETNHLSISPDAKFVVTDSQLVDIESSQVITSFRWAATVSFWRSNSSFVSICNDQVVRQYDVETGETISKDFSDWDADINESLFNFDGSQLIWVRADQTVRIVDYLSEDLPTKVHVQFQNSKRWFDVSNEGNWKGSPFIERQLRYVAKLKDGSQITLKPEEFKERFGWKNNPSGVWSPEDN